MHQFDHKLAAFSCTDNTLPQELTVTTDYTIQGDSNTISMRSVGIAKHPPMH